MAHGADAPQPPRSDFVAALLWIAFGAAIAIASWRMDRLENQDINPYTSPACCPACWASPWCSSARCCWRCVACRRARCARPGRPAPHAAYELKRFALIVALCLAFGIGLVGHGLPFWVAAALFVAATIVMLQYPQRKAGRTGRARHRRRDRHRRVRRLAITLVFQDIFLVRLP